MLYMRFRVGRTLQYVSLAHKTHTVMAPPLLSRVATERKPSAQKQSVGRVDRGADVQLVGQRLTTPVQHQVPGSQASHAALATPAYPGEQ